VLQLKSANTTYSGTLKPIIPTKGVKYKIMLMIPTYAAQKTHAHTGYSLSKEKICDTELVTHIYDSCHICTILYKVLLFPFLVTSLHTLQE